MNEFINKVELQGVIGNVKPTWTTPDGKQSFKFSLATNRCYKSENGMPIIEAQWHSVTVWEKTPNEFNWLEKGMWVHVTGYISMRKYIASDGSEGTVYEIKAENIYAVKD